MSKTRITFTVDERGFIRRICADEAVDIYIIDPRTPHDRVYRWSCLEGGSAAVNAETAEWPVEDIDHLPAMP